MPVALKRIVLSVVLYAFLLVCALIVGLHVPARSEEAATVWSPSLVFPSFRAVRPQELGAFDTKEACEAWIKSDEGQAELALVDAAAPEDAIGAECVEKPAEKKGDPA